MLFCDVVRTPRNSKAITNRIMACISLHHRCNAVQGAVSVEESMFAPLQLTWTEPSNGLCDTVRLKPQC